MKNFEELEEKILDSDEIIKKFNRGAVNNMGKIIALAVAAVTIAVTFTEISFSGFLTQHFLGSLLLLMTSAYIIYFSLADSGEKSGYETEEYKKAKEDYNSIRCEISGDDIEPLRSFCERYTEKEAQSRRKSLIFSHGLTDAMFEEYKNGKTFNKKTEKIFKKANKIKPIPLGVKTLLCRERSGVKSELEDPDKRKIPMLILKIIPSTICMTVTVSVMLSTKDGMTASDILNSILKLSALPLIGFRGYSAGYSYAKHTLSLWMETKTNILEAYLCEKEKLIYKNI